MRVAILSYHFYNSTAEGLATAKLARAMVGAGHNVAVLTSLDNPLRDARSVASSGPLAGITVHRVGSNGHATPRWWNWLDRRAMNNGAWDKVCAIPNLVHGCKAGEWGWIRAVTDQTLRVCDSSGPFDVLHTRLNHPVSHLAGLQVSKRLPRLPWCAYFSDPWPYHLYPEPYHFTVGPATRYRSEMLLERILKTAGSYVFPSERLKDHLLSRGRSKYRGKAFVAPHLAEPWGPLQGRPERDVLTIRHAGFLMRERRIEPLYDALRAFLSSKPEVRSSLRVEFLGRYPNGAPPEPPDDLRDVVRFHGHVSPEAAWDWLQAADVFLLVEANMKEGIFLPSKLADYLGGKRPIFALSPANGVTADYLRSGGGVVAQPDDVNGIAGSLDRLYELFQQGRLMDLAPTAGQVCSVSSERVIPAYERAFQCAIENK